MLHPSTKKLIDKLHEMTRRQRVDWVEGQDGKIQLDTEGYRVVLLPEPHAVLLTDPLGQEIEKCTQADFEGETDARGQPYAKFVSELYREANRHARGAERAIRKLMAQLDASDREPDPVDPPPVVAPPETLTDETVPAEGEAAITEAVATLASQVNASLEPAAERPDPVIAGPALSRYAEDYSTDPSPSSFDAEADDDGLTAQISEIADPPDASPHPVPEASPEWVSEPIAAAPEPAPLAETNLVQGMAAADFQTVEEAPLTTSWPEPVNDAGAVPQAPAEPSPVSQAAPLREWPVPPATGPVLPGIQTIPERRISLSGIGYGLGGIGRPPAPPEMPVEPAASQPAAPETVTAPRSRIVIDGTVDLPDMPFPLGEGAPAEELNRPEPPKSPAPLIDDTLSDLPPQPAPASRRFNPWN